MSFQTTVALCDDTFLPLLAQYCTSRWGAAFLGVALGVDVDFEYISTVATFDDSVAYDSLNIYMALTALVGTPNSLVWADVSDGVPAFTASGFSAWAMVNWVVLEIDPYTTRVHSIQEGTDFVGDDGICTFSFVNYQAGEQFVIFAWNQSSPAQNGFYETGAL